MFGLALSRRVIEGTAIRSWNSITHFANLLWCKFNHSNNSIMPRSRRRYHSRSRSRSRSHSYDRDREVKRRRIDSGDSSPYRRTVSPEHHIEDNEDVKSNEDVVLENSEPILIEDNSDTLIETSKSVIIDDDKDVINDNKHNIIQTSNEIAIESDEAMLIEDIKDVVNDGSSIVVIEDSNPEYSSSLATHLPQLKECKVALEDCTSLIKKYTENNSLEQLDTDELNSSVDVELIKKSSSGELNISQISSKRKKPLTPSQQKKRQERQKLREAKMAELESKKQQKLIIQNEREKQRVEKQKIKEEKEELKQKEKQEKKELKQKEMDEKQKEKELKDEKKRKEIEEREQKRKEKDELKRKEKDEKEGQKRKELQEKQKQEEQKQRQSASFVNFFTKKSDAVLEEKKCDELENTSFMPFKVKVDMRVAPLCRRILSQSEKDNLTDNSQNVGKSYLEELKGGKVIGKSGKTWPFKGFEDDDVVVVEDTNIGESIEDLPKTQTFRTKFLKFDENRRPPYFGTWRKRSVIIKPRNPLGIDKEYFDYELDSDDEWEEEDPCGESLLGSDDDDKENEDKENEGENEYEVDNDFFVPHGYLSDDEVNEEETGIESPEAHKAKLKLLKKEFEEEMKGQMHKIKARVIGCIWEKKHENTIDDAIYEFLQPFAIISNGRVSIKKRSEFTLRKTGTSRKPLSIEIIPNFIKFIHGSTNKMKSLINEFLCDLVNKGINTDVSKSTLRNEVRRIAVWMRNPDEGPKHNKFCWYVHKEFQEQYNLNLSNVS